MKKKKQSFEERKKISKERVDNVLNGIIGIFQKGDVPKAIANVIFPPVNIPATKWTLCNKLIMVAQGTYDARGYCQWNEVGRQVKKGSKAIYILAPKVIKKKDEELKETEESQYRLIGFTPLALFPVEHTDGEPVDYEQREIPAHPLLEKAEEWEIDVKSTNFFGNFLGYWQKEGIEAKEKIRLCTPQEQTFFHELAHAAHRRTFASDKDYTAYRKKSDSGNKMEIIAELSAQVLAQLVGTELESTMGNTYEYIAAHSEKGANIGQECLKVIAEVDKVLNLILDIEK